ncbi:MAG TPA: hypothetical protein PLY88_03500 [Candidatus Omnitrophota bacterium]|nr:hypothetical protein [Candidatus Omnitrophota bacterium]HRK61598.1 hypothetical protein [Candidatus Omnitrophota bacterium]
MLISSTHLHVPALLPIPIIRKLLLTGQNPFPEIGSEYKAFKPFLPQNEKVSYIGIRPSDDYAAYLQKLFKAQSALVPMVLTGSGERAAIIDCPNSKIADARMNEEGYNLLIPLADGKGIAIKRP